MTRRARPEPASPRSISPSWCPSTTRRRTCPLLWPEIRERAGADRARYEVIFVDDGSRDRSAEIVRGFREQDPRACGSSGSRPTRARRRPPTRASRRCAAGGWSSWTPISRTTRTTFPRMLAHLDQWDAVTGWRVNRGDGDSSCGASPRASPTASATRLSDETIQDSGCTFRAFRRECLRDLVLYRGFHRFIPTLLKMRGYPRASRCRSTTGRAGSASPSTASATARCRAFVDLLVVRWMKDRLLRYEIAEDLGGERGASRAGEGAAGRPRALGREAPARAAASWACELWVADVSRGAPGLRGQGGRGRGARGRATSATRCPTSTRWTSSRRPTATWRSPSECLRGRQATASSRSRSTLTVAEGRALAEVVARDRARAAGRPHLPLPSRDRGAARARSPSGRIGAVRYCTGRFAGFKRPRTDVGVTQTDAHPLLRSLRLPARAATPTAVTATLRDYLGRGIDDCRSTTVEYGDVPAFVEAGYFAPGTHPRLRDRGRAGDARRRLRHLRGAGPRQPARRRTPAGWQAPEGAVESHQGRGARAAPPRARAVPRRGDAPEPSPAVDVRGGAPRAPHGGGGAALLRARPPRHPGRAGVVVPPARPRLHIAAESGTCGGQAYPVVRVGITRRSRPAAATADPGLEKSPVSMAFGGPGFA